MQNTLQPEQTEKDLFCYVIISKTATTLASFIRFFTRYEYNHASFSFSEDLDYMYSYARYNYHTPLAGGFIEETVKRFDYRMKRPSLIKVYKLPLNEQQLEKMQTLVEDMQNNGDEYIYDTIGAMGLRFLGNRHCFTCVGFVTYLLIQSGVLPQRKKSYTIHQLDDLLEPNLIYSGLLYEYAANSEPTDKAYFEEKNRLTAVRDMAKHFKRLFHIYRRY